MLKLCDNLSQLDFLPDDPYAARISALAKTYGFGHSFVLFWVQYIENEPVAAVSRIDGNMSICCTEKADFEELKEFIKTVGFAVLSCCEEVLKELGFTLTESATNFLFAAPNVISGKEYYEKLKDRGVLVRYFGTQRLSPYVRITIGTDEEMALKGIEAFEEFCRSIHMPTTITELGVTPTEEDIRTMAEKCIAGLGGPAGKVVKLNADDIAEIFRMAR